MSTARVNGSAIPSSRNPKRRPRNEAEDSISIKRQPKRLRRSELQADTFEPPSSSHLNGHVKHTSPLANGHADRSSQRDAASDTASLAIRNRGLRASEHKRPAQRHVGGTTLVGCRCCCNLTPSGTDLMIRPRTISTLFPSYLLLLAGSRTRKIQVCERV